MNKPTTEERAEYVQDVFSRIAPRYDLMNRLMTGGQDGRWRQQVIRLAQLAPGDRLLDLGAGTGDLSREALRQQPACRPFAADFTLAMMHIGARRAEQRITWSGVDALHLPFPDGAFDAVVSGFLLRNVADLQQALKEQYRVLKPGGRFVALDTTRPRSGVLTPFVRFHMHAVIPTLGWLISGQRDAYTYLPDSTEHFVRAEELAVRLAAVHFRQVAYRRLMFGTIAIHWGVKS
ncbi:MAG TPA: ubiquinone/menaquinone biosynthesis methyltransferase [Anaerolineaceae bacterium]|jgi:demethylmenaquinone methyltransferase/2-methoxy-6-polyprenyl-1,4-benzoquinol methylase